jgi:hypothetical protein
MVNEFLATDQEFRRTVSESSRSDFHANVVRAMDDALSLLGLLGSKKAIVFRR